MSEHIKLIRTSSGDKQIDYTALANLPTVNNKQLVGSVTLSASDVRADSAGSAQTALDTAKEYTDSVKNDLLNGAGEAYDTLKELGELIDTNTSAIDALESVATGKADKVHTHVIADVTNLQSALDGKANSSHTHNYLPLSGGTLTGNLTGKYITGTWLQNTSNSDLNATPSKYVVQDDSGWLYYRTLAETKSDLGITGHTHDDRYYTESEVNSLFTRANNTLWAGTYLMNASQTVTLDAAISAQRNGIVLLFSYISDSGTVSDDHFATVFVPKQFIVDHSGKGFDAIGTSTDASFWRKYLYITDTTIKGDASNNWSSTYPTKNIALRKVYGV